MNCVIISNKKDELYNINVGIILAQRKCISHEKTRTALRLYGVWKGYKRSENKARRIPQECQRRYGYIAPLSCEH